MYAILGDELVASMLYEPLVRHARPESLEMIGGLQPEAALRSVYKDATRDKGTTPPVFVSEERTMRHLRRRSLSSSRSPKPTIEMTR